jgi:hypothetical protein
MKSFAICMSFLLVFLSVSKRGAFAQDFSEMEAALFAVKTAHFCKSKGFDRISATPIANEVAIEILARMDFNATSTDTWSLAVDVSQRFIASFMESGGVDEFCKNSVTALPNYLVLRE